MHVQSARCERPTKEQITPQREGLPEIQLGHLPHILTGTRRLASREAQAWAPLSRRHFSAVTRGSRERSLHVEPEGDCRR